MPKISHTNTWFKCLIYFKQCIIIFDTQMHATYAWILNFLEIVRGRSVLLCCFIIHIYVFDYRWKSFKRQMLSMRAHSDSKGFELKRPNDSIYSFPCPNCMCRVNKTEDSRPTPVIWCFCFIILCLRVVADLPFQL